MRKSLIASGLAVALFSGCVRNLNLEKYPRERPLIAGVDGWGVNILKDLGIAIEDKYKLPCEIVPVHYWKENMPEIRKAHQQGRKIILQGYSAGCDQVRLTALECQKEGIDIELLVYFDPTYSAWDNDLGVPKNVKRIRSYFSSESDFMDFFRAKGDISKFREAARKSRGEGSQIFEEPKIVPGNHFTAWVSESIRQEVEQEIQQYASK